MSPRPTEYDEDRVETSFRLVLGHRDYLDREAKARGVSRNRFLEMVIERVEVAGFDSLPVVAPRMPSGPARIEGPAAKKPGPGPRRPGLLSTGQEFDRQEPAMTPPPAAAPDPVPVEEPEPAPPARKTPAKKKPAPKKPAAKTTAKKPAAGRGRARKS